MSNPEPGDPNATALALLVMAEQLRPILDFVEGHREELIRRGFSPTAAEMMAAQLYSHQIHLIFTNAAAQVAAAAGGQR